MSALQARTEVLSVDGAEMDYVRFGEGAKTLVLLPGLGLHGVRENGRAQAHMYRALADGYTVYILDCPRKVRRTCTLRALAADAGRAMDALGIGQADVLGVSMGGMLAQYLALDRPELVGKLVLAVTLSRPNDTIRAVSRRWAALAEQGDQEGLARDVMASTYSDGYLQRFGRMLPLVSRKLSPPELEQLAVLTRACLTCDTYDRLDALRCTTLVVGGRQDKIVTAAASEEIADRLGCELIMYDELGHSVCEEASRDFCARVLDFLQK